MKSKIVSGSTLAAAAVALALAGATVTPAQAGHYCHGSKYCKSHCGAKHKCKSRCGAKHSCKQYKHHCHKKAY